MLIKGFFQYFTHVFRKIIHPVAFFLVYIQIVFQIKINIFFKSKTYFIYLSIHYSIFIYVVSYVVLYVATYVVFYFRAQSHVLQPMMTNIIYKQPITTNFAITKLK